jgi:hypothetical protein
MQERLEEFLKDWDKINQKMRNIQFPEFDAHENLSDIVKQFEEHDQKFEDDFLEIKNLEKGQVKNFIDGKMIASTILRNLGSKVVWFKKWVVEMKDELRPPMEQCRFL